MNLRPSGYEPDELPDCSTPRRYPLNMTAALPRLIRDYITWAAAVKAKTPLLAQRRLHEFVRVGLAEIDRLRIELLVE